MIKTLIWYKRVSTDRQIDGHGLQRQQDFFNNYLDNLPDRNSYRVEEISDEGLSAFHGVNVSDKGGLGSILQRIQSGDISAGSILVCESQSRLTRLHAVDATLLIHTLNKAGIKVWSLADNREITTDSDTGLIMAVLDGIRNRAYSQDISDKVSKKKKMIRHAVRVDRTATYGNICPHWLKVTDNGFEPIPEHVATIQRIFRERYELRSMASIAAGLNQDEIPLITSRNWKKKAAPTGWSQSTVKNLLSNERVIGTLPASTSTSGDKVTGYYGSPIVPLEHWLAAQESLSHRGKKAVRNEANPFAVRLFKSLIVCKHCGHRMDVNGARQAHSERGSPYQGSLICRGSRDNSCMCGENGTRTPALPMKLVEHSLTTNLFRSLKQRDITTGAQEQIARLRLKITEAENDLAETAPLVVTQRNAIARQALQNELDKLADSITQWRSDLALLERKQQATTFSTLEGLNLMTVDGRSEAQRVIAKSIATISIDTVTALADITLRNGNIIQSFDLRSTDDFTSTMTNATDFEYHEEIAMIIGENLPVVYLGNKPLITNHEPDFSGWPDVEDDYPNTDD
ncbi:recombinase family protein [Atlantibacter hermannii]|uniref:recombinase family protein n=1 Tax=Atlantibacter hermannii TaxID=565 RepID=UPI002DBE1458|nr:recombinase family protein [Atlantibacter hermannii]MEB7923563.1 recombinase family protein [Atlantibacter hermannii]